MCAALLALCGGTAMAQTPGFAPEAGVAYTIYCAGTGGHYVYYDSSDANVPNKDERGGVESYFTFTAAGDGNYYISPVSDQTRFMCYTSTSNAVSSLGWTSTSGGNDTKWVIAPSTAEGHEGEFTISPLDKTDTYLNCFDGSSSTHMGFWTGATDVNSQFAIEPVVSYDANSAVSSVENLANGDYVLNIHNTSGGGDNANATGLVYYHNEGSDNQRRYRAIYNFAFENGLVTDNRYVWTLAWNAEHTAFTLQNKALPTIYLSVATSQNNKGRGDMVSGGDNALFEPVAIEGTNRFFLKLQGHTVTGDGTEAGQPLFLFTNNAGNGFKNLSYWNAETQPATTSGGVQMEFLPVAATQAADIDLTMDYDADFAAAVEAMMSLSGTGYPVADVSTRQPLADALAAYKEGAQSGSVLIATYNALQEAYNDYLLSSNVQMPEDGKAYTLTFVGSDANASEYYLNYDAENYQIVAVSRTEGAELPESARFIVRHIDGNRYLFALPSGKYLVWKGNANNDGTNSNKGVINAYDEAYVLTLEHARPNQSSSMTAATAENIFGTFTLAGKRADNTRGYFLLNNNGTFNKANAPYFNGSITSCIRIEEAPAYYNTVNLQQPADDSYAYSTVYLPFAVDVPQGVEAFTGSLSEGEGETTLHLSGIADGVIPARTAVVLRAATDGSMALVPSTATGTAVEANALQGTLDASATTPANTYALSGAFAEGIGFYPYTATTLPAGKAYLTLTDAQAVQKLAFSFGQGTTGIDAIEAGAADKAATWYDLSGRRVDNPTKGVYIVNGKKVIVK